MSMLSNAISHPLKAAVNIGTLGQRDKLEKAYRSSGLRDFYEKNKSTILNTAGIVGASALTGGLAGALGSSGVGFGAGAGIGTGALLTTPGVYALGGAAALGHLKDKKREVKQAAANFASEQQAQKDKAASNLDQIINGITGPSSPSAPTKNNQVSTMPVPQFNGGTPYVMNPTTGQPVYQGTPEFQQLLNSGQIVFGGSNQLGGKPLGTSTAQSDAQKILQEAELARQSSTSTLEQQKALRQQQIQDLSNLLTEQAKTQYERQLPGLYEDLNTRGLLRSSELGNQMALRQQQSYEDVANQLAQQQLGYNDQYITGLGGVNTNYLSGRGSALQREFSLEDYANQLKASKELGQAVAPMQAYSGGGKNSGNILGGASLGASLGGPAGAAVGGLAGGKLS